MAAASLPSAPVFGSEAPRIVTISLSSKRALHPTLTHQFTLTWPWPTQLKKRMRGVATATPSPTSCSADQRYETEEQEEEEKDGNEGERNVGVPSAPDSGTLGDHLGTMVRWRDRRRYGPPTFILDFSSDPFLRQHRTRRVGLLLSPGYRLLLPLEQLSTPEELPDKAGVAFWRTPFKPSWSPDGAPPALGSSTPFNPPPYCAELLVGELTVIEQVARERRTAPSSATARRNARGFRTPSFLSRISLGSLKPAGVVRGDAVVGASSLGALLALTEAEDESLVPPATDASPLPAMHTDGSLDVAVAPAAGPSHSRPLRKSPFHPPPPASSPSPSSLPSPSSPSHLPPSRSDVAPRDVGPIEEKRVFHFFFYTIPFRVRWLSQVPSRIVVSLPCEECVVTLATSHASADGASEAGHPHTASGARRSAAAYPGMVAMPLICRYALPRGVVPLDIAEVLERPFLAVGTAEHGVLLCHLDTTTGAVQDIARWISVKGYSSALYPIARLTTVFPPLPRRGAPAAGPGGGTSTPPAWTCRAAALESLSDGALVCSSPYELTAALIKLGGPAEGSLEDFPVARNIETILDVGATLHPAVGPLVCTASRKLQRLRIVSSTDDEVERRTTVLSRNTDVSIADRVRPCVVCERLLRWDQQILHVAASPPVIQRLTKSYVCRSNYTKHWHVAVDSQNRLVLLDRSASQYLPHSSFQLRATVARNVSAEWGQSGQLTATASGEQGAACSNQTVSVKEKVGGSGAKRNRAAAAATTEERKVKARQKMSNSPTRPRAVAPPIATEDDEETTRPMSNASPTQLLVESVPIENACSGLAVIAAKDTMLQVAAAHDRDCISVVTWQMDVAPPKLPGHARPLPTTSTARAETTEVSLCTIIE